MRLDHLLSREQTRSESGEFISQVDPGRKLSVRWNRQVPKRIANAFLLCIIFRVRISEEIRGGLAQLGERLPCKQEVSGSIPLISTIIWIASSAD